MAYDLAWGSTHPGLLIYLVDLSGSMDWNDKLTQVSKVVWNVVDCLVAQCQNDGVYRNRFQLKVIGYNEKTYKIFDGDVNAMNDRLDENPNDEQFFNVKKGNTVSGFAAEGLTHMAMAFDKASEIIKEWISRQNFKNVLIPAPIVINITDGYPEEKGLDDQEAREKALKSATALKQIAVPDGNVLLFNIHIGENLTKNKTEELILPSECPPNERQAFLFNASSQMDSKFVSRAQGFQLPAVNRSKFMVANMSDVRMLGRLIVFGSSVSGLPNANRREIPLNQ